MEVKLSQGPEGSKVFETGISVPQKVIIKNVWTLICNKREPITKKLILEAFPWSIRKKLPMLP